MAGEDRSGLKAVGGGELEPGGSGTGASDWSRSEGRKFAFPVGGAFVALGGLLWWRGHPLPASGAVGVGVLLVLAGAAIPGRLQPVYRAWMRMARAISKVTTPIIMGLFYYLALTPTGFLRRHLGTSPLVRDDRDGSYWIDRGGSGQSDLERQF